MASVLCASWLLGEAPWDLVQVRKLVVRKNKR